MSDARKAALKLKQQQMLLRAMTDPMWLGMEVMGYDRLTDGYHKPMMEDMWVRDLRRPLFRDAIKQQVELGILPSIFLETALTAGKPYYKEELEEHPRDHYKTTMLIIRCAKIILVWPLATIAHWHAVEGKAQECSEELGDHFMTNKLFRSIRPEIMPKTTDRRFNTASGFRLDKDELGTGSIRKLYAVKGKHIPKERHPTFFPKGAGAEVTGGHAAIGWLDDIIGQSTIDDSAMPKIRNWLGHTVSHVIRTDGGWRWATGTPWDEDDVYVDMEKDPNYDCRIRAALETDGKRDYDGEPVLYDKRWIEKKKKDPLCNFPYQMMVDRVPDSERRWPGDWDGFCKTKWAMEGNGRVFVLSDPAPMGLSLRGDKDRVRGDTGKDWWSISVVRLRVRGDFQDLILLDGNASQSWTDTQGYDEACRLMKKWRTNMFLDEDYSGGQFFGTFMKACRRNGVMPYTELDGKKRRMWPKYLESYQKNAKNKRFQKICDMADTGAVWVAESCPESFWKGDGEFTGALTQAQKWIPRKGGESTLKWDDHFDSWARATDRKLQEFAPQPSQQHDGTDVRGFDPFWSARNREESKGYRPKLTRYI